jgi:hypothetical protein
MNSFVTSKPAEDFRARWRVLMTSPEGSTTVYGKTKVTRTTSYPFSGSTYRVQKPLSLRSTVANGVCLEV